VPLQAAPPSEPPPPRWLPTPHTPAPAGRPPPQGADRRPSYRARLSHVRSLLSERRGPPSGASPAHAPAPPGASWPATPGSYRPGAAPPAAGAAFEAALASAGAATGAGDTQASPLPPRALVGLAPPKPLGSALLMRRPWALLLRLALQLGLSQVRRAVLRGVWESRGLMRRTAR
jgi:hypothetical protein